MKKKVVILGLLFVLVLAGCSTVATSAAVTLPAELVALIGFAATLVFTALGKWLFDKIGIDLSDRLGEIASAVAAIVVVLINWAIGLVPAAYDNLLNAIFAFLVVWLGGVGTFSMFFRKKDR